MKFLKVLPVIALMLFAGCGGGSQEPAGEQEQQMETADDVRTIDIVGTNSMKFGVTENADGITVGDQLPTENDLVRLQTITAAPGETIRINLTTRSTMPAQAMAHNWVLLTLGADIQAFADASGAARDNDYIAQDMMDMVVAQTGLAAGGETVSVTITIPEETGEYDYLCTFPGHYAAGMTGKLVVEESQM